MTARAGPLAGGAVCLLVAGWGLWAYPLAAWPLAVFVLAYGAALARWPGAFLLVIPATLPALDLGLWTGWLVLGEADLVLLVTLAVLLVRTPPEPRDLWPGGVAGIALAAFAGAMLLATAIGLAAPLGHDPASANPFLRPENALRLAKGFAAALVLLPFIRQRQRLHGDAPRLLAMGMLLGLGAVALQVAAERILFAGLLDFASDYRVVGAFSSMRVGGGHIGAWLAMALPFLLAFGLPRSIRQAALLPLLGVLAIAGLYALAVTFARTAYLAGAAALGLAGLLWLAAAQRRAGAGRRWAAWLALLPVAGLIAGLALAASSAVMRERIARVAGDWQTREANWDAGWAARDTGPAALAFGIGLGTYQRAMLSRSPVNRPSDLALHEDAEGRFLTLRTETPLYLGQKLVPAPEGVVRFTARIRIETAGASLGVVLCDKMLVYSDNCRGAQLGPVAPGGWQAVSGTIDAAGLGGGVAGLARPVEFSLFDRGRGTRLSVRDIALTDGAGRALLANADFADGLDRWLFTDDSHVSWRILNQYLMLVFETGIAGLLAFLALAAAALAGAVRAAAWRGEAAGAAVAGAIAAFLVSGLFDHVLEAPRVATAFFLITLTGLVLGEAARGKDSRA